MRPFEHLVSPDGETPDQVRHMVAYLVDHTALISNPGVAPSTPSTRTAVAVLERISKLWRKRTQTSKYNHYIIRRYVAMDTGVMLMYPGALLPQNYDPTTRSWYLRALQFAGRLVFTGPYLDDGGAGSIVTLSYAIMEGNSSGVHTPGLARVTAVVAMDVTHRFLSLLLAEWLHECGPTLTGRSPRAAAILPLQGQSQYMEPKAFGLPISVFASLKNASYEAIAQILRASDLAGETQASSTAAAGGKIRMETSLESMKCLLLDDRGYLDAHPGFAILRASDLAGETQASSTAAAGGKIRMETSLESMKCLLLDDRGYLEAHPGFAVEPLIAADLLKHADFVRKVACASYTQRSLQRYYLFNTSYLGVVTNFAPGEQCMRYQAS
ncbi:unnamed protein product [Schistocephalus solidus]|uniref:Triplex capsid protein 1 n=1 Tax=Schistocephalus solidus TaxID=70667 RepID=A0A183TUB7_SCHSO|nr:unnamed protein product [Schistocephalus solidus]